MGLDFHLSGAAKKGGDAVKSKALSAIRYQRLPGTRRGLLARASAWAAPDHILLIEGSRVRETYKRVYFRDVQALLVMRRNRFLIQTPWLLVLPAMLIAVLRLPGEWRATGGSIAVLALLAILVYLYVAAVFGGCRLYLATAVGNVKVASVFRVWQARRFHDRVTPLIVAAQTHAPPIESAVTP
jgi:hypothetical protein